MTWPSDEPTQPQRPQPPGAGGSWPAGSGPERSWSDPWAAPAQPPDPWSAMPAEEPTRADPYAGAAAGYPQPISGGYPSGGQPGTNTMAVLAFVFALLFWPLGLVFGHLAKRQIARTGESGGGLATAALVISYLLLGLMLCGCLAAVVVARST